MKILQVPQIAAVYFHPSTFPSPKSVYAGLQHAVNEQARM